MRLVSEEPTQQPQLQHPTAAATTIAKRRGSESETVAVTEENLPNMKNVVILQKEGIIYCPIAKVNVHREAIT